MVVCTDKKLPWGYVEFVEFQIELELEQLIELSLGSKYLTV